MTPRRIAIFFVCLGSVSWQAASLAQEAADRVRVSDELRHRTGQGLRPPGSEPGLPPGVSLGEPLSEDAAVTLHCGTTRRFRRR